MAAIKKVTAQFEKVAAELGRLRDLVYAAGLLEDDPVDPPTTLPFVLPPNSNGIDVSKWQGAIDWPKVKAGGLVSFAFIKASEGIGGRDPLFVANWSGAKLAGIPRGAYHFYRFAFDPILQANFFCSLLGQDVGELPPVLDVEDDVKFVKADSTIKAFCERVFELTGKRCLIYTGAWWWTASRLGQAQPWVKDYPLWIAAYVPKPSVPKDWMKWTFWQYANNGRIDGINGNVDLNLSAP